MGSAYLNYSIILKLLRIFNLFIFVLFLQERGYVTFPTYFTIETFCFSLHQITHRIRVLKCMLWKILRTLQVLQALRTD